MSAPEAPVAHTHVYRWDLDKTYLKTDFDSLRSLIKTAFEKPEDKLAVPGASALLRELRGGGTGRICFISGSPRQMRKVLTRKLHLDGVEFDEFILKPNLRNMLTGRFRAMREQVGYKLPALLAGRAGLPAETPETCFGDDAESDGFIYSLYADVIARRIDRPSLEKVLVAAGTYPADALRALALAQALPEADAVRRIFIRLDRHSPTARFDRYGARLVPIFNYLQVAAVLYQDGLLPPAAVGRVALEMIDRFAYSIDALKNSLEDLIRRNRLRTSVTAQLGRELLADAPPAMGQLPGSRERLEAFAQKIAALPETRRGTALKQEPIDYLAALEADLPYRRK
ncbi:MAG: phosphatase domain-containing protein [Polyangia bacterium]